MFSKSGLAVVTKYEAVHRLVSPVNLHLDEPCFIAATLFAKEEALELLALGFHELVFPIGAVSVHPSLLHEVSFCLQGF
jgi:hypothetical protein